MMVHIKIRNMLTRSFLLMCALVTTAAADDVYYQEQVRDQLQRVDDSIAAGRFKDNWESLRQFRYPEWFRDAKFGIFIHWGPYSVPAFANEWYSRNMYVPGNAAYEHHLEVFGPHSEFGYKDFIPLFRGENFDPQEWVELFENAGARYVMPVAEHCDGFAMYATDFSEWDASEMGPRRDVVDELAKATRARGLHFTLSSHRAEHWWWYYLGRTYDSDVNDPQFAGLYGPAAPMGLPADPPESWPGGEHLQLWTPPDKAFLDDWMARSSELVDKYQPELFYLDWWTSAPLFEPLMRKFAAYYYGEAEARSFGQVAIVYKGGQFAEGTALFDMERGTMDGKRLTPWQSDTSVSIGSWGYVDNDKYRTPKSLVSDLIDIVSKNGNLLLNVGPKADGTIPEEARNVLLAMGDWLKVNGEGVFESRPFHYYGEGPTHSGAERVPGQVEAAATRRYTPEDFRFTTRDGAVYIFGLQYPEERNALVKTLYAGTPYLERAIDDIELLGHGSVKWRQTRVGLELQLPPAPADDMPYTLKLTFQEGVVEPQSEPFRAGDGIFDHAEADTLGLAMAPGAETYTVFRPDGSSNGFNHGVVLMPFKGRLYAQWQTSARDEDASDSYVLYSYSDDGKSWSEPGVLAPPWEQGIRTSGGWWTDGDTLVAYINEWPDSADPSPQGVTRFITSEDGVHWSEPQPVRSADGEPVAGIFEQDPHALPDGRIISAFHEQPGLMLSPWYTDDPLGVSGWTRGTMPHLPFAGNTTREMEPSWFYRDDGAVVMIFRDQGSSFRKLASVSHDRGATWSLPVVTNMHDSRSKQSAGNLPDGTAFQVNNPSGTRTRIPLVITLSKAGHLFDTAFLLRSGGSDLQPQRAVGKHKGLGYSYPKSVLWNDHLYVAYAVNKEDVEITRVPWRNLSQQVRE